MLKYLFLKIERKYILLYVLVIYIGYIEMFLVSCLIVGNLKLM